MKTAIDIIVEYFPNLALDLESAIFIQVMEAMMHEYTDQYIVDNDGFSFPPAYQNDHLVVMGRTIGDRS